MIPVPPPVTLGQARVVTFAPVYVGQIADGPHGRRFLARPACCPHRLFVAPTAAQAIRACLEDHLAEKTAEGGVS